MIQLQFGQPMLALAPMEGLIESPMRELLTEGGGFTYCVAEFLRITQEVPPIRTFFHHLPELHHGGMTPAGIPVQTQLLGGDPDRLAQAAFAAYQAGSQGVDLNFGCPAPIVNRHDGGATLLKFPERILKIVSTVRSAVPSLFPVSVKLRLGWDDPRSIHINAEMAVKGGASWITIHGRTRVQGYVPPAYWKPIGQVKRRIGIPVIANGEIWTVQDFNRCRDETECEHYMLGRGALADPVLSLKIAHELGIANFGSQCIVEAPRWGQLFRRFSEVSKKFTNRPGYAPSRVKQWSQIIHKQFPTTWYDKIKVLSTMGEILEFIDRIEHDLHAFK